MAVMGIRLPVAFDEPVFHSYEWGKLERCWNC